MTRRHVEDMVTAEFIRGSGDIDACYIRDIDKVTRLPAVISDTDGIGSARCVSETRYHATVGRGRILTWTEDIKIAERYCFKPVKFCIEARVIFAHSLV